jgi:hypothetical protein
MTIDCLVRLPLAGVFIWCGFHTAAMAWIVRNNIERAARRQTIIVLATGEKFAQLGVSQFRSCEDFGSCQAQTAEALN